MITINLILLILIIAVIIKIILWTNDKDVLLNNKDEQLVLIPKRIIPQYCSDCGNLNTSTCSTCSNCGICVTDGVATCVPGDAYGPYFRQDCDRWNPESYTYTLGIPSYINYNYTYDLPHYRRTHRRNNNNRPINRPNRTNVRPRRR